MTLGVSSMSFIYLDHHATTPCDPRVLEAMLPWFVDAYGNPGSGHYLQGAGAREAVARAREQVAQLIGASPKEIVFTSGATESDNTAVIGVARAQAHAGKHIICTNIEHSAVLDSCRFLESEGWEVSYLPVDNSGRLKAVQVADAIRDDTTLVSIILANNEIGVIQPVAEIGALCRERGVTFHTDAAQALGRIPVDVGELGVDLLSLTAHKMHGPKGIGALYIRRGRPRVKVEPIIHGGRHERGMRSGTLAPHQIVGFGKTCEIALAEIQNGEPERLGMLRDRLWQGLNDRIDGIRINGCPENRLPNNLNVCIQGVEGKALLMGIRDLAVSSGSACNTENLRPSHVLVALGIPDDDQHTSIRFGLGRFNTQEEVDFAISLVAEKVEALRAMSPV